MKLNRAVEILGDSICEEGNISGVRNEYVLYRKSENVITLDGTFRLEELEALVVYARQTTNELRKPETSAINAALAMPYDRVLLSKLGSKGEWVIVSNPSYGSPESACSSVLMNRCNAYVEYENTGSITRMVRVEDIEKYGIKLRDIPLGCILRRDSLGV